MARLWSESTLLHVANFMDQGVDTAMIARILDLTYTEAKRYVQLVERRQALPYVMVRRTMKKAPAPTGA